MREEIEKLRFSQNTDERDYDLFRRFISENKRFPFVTTVKSMVIKNYTISYTLFINQIENNENTELVYSINDYCQGREKVILKYKENFVEIPHINYSDVNNYKNLSNEILNAKTSGGSIPVIHLMRILHYYENLPQEIDDMIKNSYIEEEYIPSVSMISKTQEGFHLNEMNISKSFSEDLDLHYGEGFNNFHDKLLKRLINKNKGISLLHGKQGTGKSYYIKKLIKDLKYYSSKKVIVLPSNSINYLLEPEFNNFLLSLVEEQQMMDMDDSMGDVEEITKGMILILEDAEPAISDRGESFDPQKTSNVLNFTDGILNDIFGIQIIATFNDEEMNIDEAITRKQRLIAKKEFKELSENDSVKLARQIGVEENLIQNEIINKKDQKTVADIYGLLENEDNDVLIEENDDKKQTSSTRLSLE